MTLGRIIADPMQSAILATGHEGLCVVKPRLGYLFLKVWEANNAASPESFSIALALVMSLALVPFVSANWYAGNMKPSQYGVRALVYAPASAPYTVTWQDNWVSTPATPSFVQAGWNYGPSVGYARRYVEHLVGWNLWS